MGACLSSRMPAEGAISQIPELEDLLALLRGTATFFLASSLLELCCCMQVCMQASHPFLLHPTKCRCLAASYFVCVKRVLATIHTISRNYPHDRRLCFGRLNAILEALEGAIREGSSFLALCESPQTINQFNKTLSLALTTDIVHHHLHDLVWCMSCLFQAFDSLSNFGCKLQEAGLVQEIPGLLNEIWKHVDENQDRESILMFLRKAGSHKRELENFISHRLSEGGHDGNRELADNQLPTYLWMDPEGFRGDECIGKGSFGEVCKVRWMGGMFASKDFFHVEDDELFLREASIHAKLRHSNVVLMVCCTKSATVGHKRSLVMELMHRDLWSLIKERSKSGHRPPFPLLEAVDLMLQIAKGMEYLHSLHIIHRDLRAANILASDASSLNSKGYARVKIADFGMSKIKSTSSLCTTHNIGATAWRAPEVFDINPTDRDETAIAKYTNRADVYSFAMVCYEILMAKAPYEDCKQADIRKKVKAGERPILPKSCPPALASYIKLCWHDYPLKRPTFTQICTVLRFLKSCILCGDWETLAFRLDGNIWDLNVNIAKAEENICCPALKIISEMTMLRQRLNEDVKESTLLNQGVYQSALVRRIELVNSSSMTHSDAFSETTKSVFTSPRATIVDPYNPNEAYFFAGNYFIKIRIKEAGAEDALLSEPRLIEEHWTSLQVAKFGTVDAAFPDCRGGGLTWVFCNDQYVSIRFTRDASSISTSSVHNYGPFNTFNSWPVLRNAGFNKVNAVFPRPGSDDEVYFFSGQMCALIKVIPATSDDYFMKEPCEIIQEWPALKEAGFSTVDAVLPSPEGNGLAYFFSQNLYALIQLEPGSYKDKLVHGPLDVRQYWPSLREAAFY